MFLKVMKVLLHQATAKLAGRKVFQAAPLAGIVCAGIALASLAAPVRPPLEERLDSEEEAPSGQYALGQELYTKNCSICHLTIPAAVFPSETWRQLLSDSAHYGARIELPIGPERLLVWQYLRDYSRELIPNEPTPYRFGESRLFRALHPKVDLPRELTARSCLACHPAAVAGNFRRLDPRWTR
jgi:cytochrome c5